MTTKKLSLAYGTNLDYKLIRDGYKTVNGSVVIDENTPKTISLEVPQEVYSLPDIININTDTKSAPIVTLTKDLELPDGTVNSKQEYILGEYGKKYIVSDNIRYNNFTISGNILIDNNHIVSGFSTSNYLMINTPSVVPNTFDIQFKITTSANDESSARILNAIGGSDTVNGLYIVRESKDIQLVFYDGSSYRRYIAISGSEDGVTYIFRWVWDGTTVKSYYSTTTEEDFILNEELEATTFPLAAFNYSMGVRTLSPKYTLFNGSIDLNKSYIKLNDEIVWKPQCSSFAAGYRVDGPAILDTYNTISNLINGTNVMPYFSPCTENWEFSTKFKTGNNLGSDHNQILHNITQSYAMAITKYHSTGYPMSSYINNTWTEGKVAMELNTEYWFKFINNNKVCSLYVKKYEEGESEPTIDQMTLSCTVTSNNSFKGNAFAFSVDGSQWWTGSIDLNHTYFLEDGVKYRMISTKQCNFGPYTYGYPTINHKYITWNCNSSNYYKINIDLSNYNTFEIYIKIKTPNASDNNGAFFANNSNNASPFRRDGTALGSWSPSEYISGYSMPNNTTHWIKGYSDGTTWYTYGKEDKGEKLEDVINSTDWILAGSCNASYMIINGINNFIFGRNTDYYSGQYFTGEIYLSDVLIKKNNEILFKGMDICGKELLGILNSSLEDSTEEKTYNLYDVQTDKRSLILSEDKNLNIDNIEFIEYCGQITIPAHTIYEYDGENEIWDSLPVIINYSIPEGAIITIDDVIVETSPYVTNKIGEIVYKVNKEGYEEYIGQINYAFGGSTYEITITEDDMIFNSSSEGPSISPDTPSLTRQYYAFTPTDNAFLTSANTNGNVSGDTSTFYTISEEVGTHQILYMLNPETNNMIEITNVELVISSSSLEVYPLRTGTQFFQSPKQTDAVRNAEKDIVTNATVEASTTATITSTSIRA